MDTSVQPQRVESTSAKIYPPSTWELTSSRFLADLAKFWTIPTLSAPQTVYLCFEVLHGYDAEPMRDLNGKPIDFDAEYKDGMDIFEWAFGGDFGRGMRRLQERAERPFPNRMKSTPKLLTRILLLHYARGILKAQQSANEVSHKTAAE